MLVPLKIHFLIMMWRLTYMGQLGNMSTFIHIYLPSPTPHRVVGYGYTYPQFLQRYRLPSEEANDALVESSIRQLTRHLETLENGYLAKGRFLTGDRLTVADSVVATILLQTEWLGFKFKMWPKVELWLKLVRAQDYWSDVHAAHKKFLVELENAQYYDD